MTEINADRHGHTEAAVFFFENDTERDLKNHDENTDGSQTNSRPIMLESILFCPILTWAGEQLVAEGVRRFFIVCHPRWEEEVRSCLPEDTEVIVSEQHRDLLAFLERVNLVQVFPHPAFPAVEAGAGFSYTAEGTELRECWTATLSNAVPGAKSAVGWLPVYDFSVLAEIEAITRKKQIALRRKAGVRIPDDSGVCIDPRALIAPGTTILPGSLIQGACEIARNCVIGPQALVNRCQLGAGVTVNASQINESVLADGCDVGPYAHIRPNCVLGKKCHIGAFVQLKNCTLGNEVKMSHLTYVGDTDVGAEVNFGCGTVTCNYDGFAKHRCVIGDGAFIGCNTNLVSPVRIGAGAYIAAGSTITADVPGDALAVARERQKILPDWAARKRKLHDKT